MQMNSSSLLIPSELADLSLLRGYSNMGILSIISILFTISLVFARNGSKTYKYLTAQSLIAYLLFDIQLCFITCPHLMMQQLTGYTLGILTLSAKWQFLHSRLKWMMTFFAFDLGHCAMCISVALAIKNAVEDESSPPWLLNRNSIFIPWSIFAIWAFLHITGALLFLIGLVSFTFWHMNYTLKETRKFLSPTTAYLQRLAVIALAAQCFVPVFTVILPHNLHFLATFLPPLDPNVTCYTMFLFSSNSIVSTVAIIFSTPDYRRYFFRYFSNRSTPVSHIKPRRRLKSSSNVR